MMVKHYYYYYQYYCYYHYYYYYHYLYYYDLDEREFAEHNKEQVELQGITSFAFQHSLQAIYTGHADSVNSIQEPQQLMELLEPAERFGLVNMQAQIAKRVATLFEGDVGLTPQTVGRWLVVGRQYSIPSLVTCCLSYVKEHRADVMLAAETIDSGTSDYGTYCDIVESATGSFKRQRRN